MIVFTGDSPPLAICRGLPWRSQSVGAYPGMRNELGFALDLRGRGGGGDQEVSVAISYRQALPRESG